MSLYECPAVPWCETSGAHEGLAHTRLVFSAASQAQTLHTYLSMSQSDQGRFVGLSVMDALTARALNDTFQLSPGLCEALGALILSLHSDDVRALGEALARAGAAMGGPDE